MEKMLAAVLVEVFELMMMQSGMLLLAIKWASWMVYICLLGYTHMCMCIYRKYLQHVVLTKCSCSYRFVASLSFGHRADRVHVQLSV